MAGKESPRRKQYDQQPRITKDTLLKALEDVEDEIKKLGRDSLHERLRELRGQVEVVLQNQEEEIKNLRREIQNLKKEVENLKVKNEGLGKLAVAQATWSWEAHLARFVVDPSTQVFPEYRFLQMQDYVKGTNPKQNRWKNITETLQTKWTKDNWHVVNRARNERNSIAHPDLIDLDLVVSEIATTMSPNCQKRMNDMLDMLKMTASLMKFGRLAVTFPSAEKRSFARNALAVIISWDRTFEDINGLQNIEHEEAKGYLKLYVNNRAMKDQCVRIVDYIKNVNSKRLGKLAWKMENDPLVTKEYGEALNKMKQLLPNPHDESNVEVHDKTTAKLHIPDFLPKSLWKDGIEIVEEYFKELSKKNLQNVIV
jgi:hypothetical protein